MTYDQWKLSNPIDDGYGYDMVSNCCGREYIDSIDNENDIETIDDYVHGLGNEEIINPGGEVGRFSAEVSWDNDLHPSPWQPTNQGSEVDNNEIEKNTWNNGYNDSVDKPETGHHAFWTHTDDLCDRHGVRCNDSDKEQGSQQ